MKTIFIVAGVLLSFHLIAQPDTLFFKNNNIIIGELKSLDRGVAIIETDYSKEDFKIEWREIEKISTTSIFQITTSEGIRYQGHLSPGASPQLFIISREGRVIEVPIIDIVLLSAINEQFLDKLSASISLGYNITRAENLEQLSLRSSIGYKSKRWSGNIKYDVINSKQDEIESIARKDGSATFNYLLPKDWYIPISVTYLSNTEQLIHARWLSKIGFGKFLLHRNKAYWGISMGANSNYENYLDDTPDRKTWEGFIGSELNLFDIGDLSLLTKLVVYPSITETDRVRSDFTFDLKYDLPLDFFIGMGATVNYDSQPIENAPQTDYVIQTTLGWKW